MLISLVGTPLPIEFELVVSTWHHDKKVNFEKPELIDALYETRCPVGTPWWKSDAIDIFNGTLDDEHLEEVDKYAKSPIAQQFALVRLARMRAAGGTIATLKTLP